MERMAKFERVSLEQFQKDWEGAFGTIRGAKEAYDTVQLPRRATAGSAGYDFFGPKTFTLAPGESIWMPTGLRVRMKEGYVLACFPRSGFGFRYRLQLDNTVGIIDQDYYGSENEGHIQAKLTNDSKDGQSLTIPAGTAFMQGVFLPFGVTEDDNATAKRTGGFGSTTR